MKWANWPVVDNLPAEAGEKASLIKVRYFAGLSDQEAVQSLRIRRSIAGRYRSYAKAG